MSATNAAAIARNALIASLALALCALLGCPPVPQLPSGEQTDFILDPDGTVTIIAREGDRTRLGLDRVVGCGQNCFNLCTYATGTGFANDNADILQTHEGVGSISFLMGAVQSTQGFARSQCALWSQPFVVGSQDQVDASELLGDVVIDCVGKFTTAGANGYEILVEVALVSGDFPEKAKEELKYCYVVGGAGGATLELCNDPPDPVENFGVQITDFKFNRHIVYRAVVSVASTITSEELTTLGGQISGSITITDLTICIGCQN